MGDCQLDGDLQRFNLKGLVVDVLGFDFQFLLTGFADPVVFSIDEGVVVDTFAVIFGAEVTLHNLLTSGPPAGLLLVHRFS